MSWVDVTIVAQQIEELTARDRIRILVPEIPAPDEPGFFAPLRSLSNKTACMFSRYRLTPLPPVLRRWRLRRDPAR